MFTRFGFHFYMCLRLVKYFRTGDWLVGVFLEYSDSLNLCCCPITALLFIHVTITACLSSFVHFQGFPHRLDSSFWIYSRRFSYPLTHPQLCLWPGGSRIIRREESVLIIIRIGHTHLTHGFLLKGEDPPQCIACDCHLTVKHILFDCVDFIESGNGYCNVNSFKELFETVPPDSILSFLHEIGLFYRL